MQPKDLSVTRMGLSARAGSITLEQTQMSPISEYFIMRTFLCSRPDYWMPWINASTASETLVSAVSIENTTDM